MTISTSLIIFSPSRPVPLAQVADGLAFIPHSIYYTISQHTTNRRY